MGAGPIVAHVRRMSDGQVRYLGSFEAFRTHKDVLEWLHQKFSVPGCIGDYVIAADFVWRTPKSKYAYGDRIRLVNTVTGHSDVFKLVHFCRESPLGPSYVSGIQW